MLSRTEIQTRLITIYQCGKRIWRNGVTSEWYSQHASLRISHLVKDSNVHNTLIMPYYDAVMAKQPEKLKEYIKKLIKEY